MKVSALGAVMAFLYTSYIVMNSILSTVLGKVIDKDFTKNGNIYHSLQTVGGIHFSVACAIIIVSTFIPKGAFALNPKALGHITPHNSTLRATQQHQAASSDNDSEDEKNFKKGDLEASTPAH